MDLKFDILNLLAKKDLRPSEIREILLPEYEKKRGYSKRSFDVIIYRELSRLDNFVNRKDKGHQRVFYAINKKGLEELQRIKVRNLTESFDVRGLNSLRNLINRILEEDKDPYRVFNEYCFAFIGDEPIAFSKGYAEFVINLDRRIRTGYSREFDACMERCMGDKRTSQSIRACLPVCQEEIGGTVGEYWRKLKKKAEKLPFPQRMWITEGYSDEEIEKMLDDLKKQERYREKS